MPSILTCTLSRIQKPSESDDLDRLGYTLTYDINTDAVMGHRALIVAAHSATPHPLPTYGGTYSYIGDSDDNSYLTNFKINGDPGDQKWYHVDAIYKPPPDDITIFEPNPFLRAPVVWIDKERRNKLIEKDATGKVMVNLCGRPYDLPPEREVPRGIWVIEFNVATLGEVSGYTRGYEDALNSTPWTFQGVNVPARVAWMQSVSSAPPIKQGAITYYHLSFRIAFADSESTWDVPVVEQGYQYFQKKGGLFVQDPPGTNKMFPPNGEPTPVLLAADGTKLPDKQLGIATNQRVIREVNFNLLPFTG